MEKKNLTLSYSLSIILLTFVLQSCTPNTHSPLTIATAANMQFAMDSLTHAFETETGIPVETVISSSGKLTAQIREGAPFDLFISADLKYPQALFGEGLTLEKPKVYARGKLVLWDLRSNEKPEIERLVHSEIKHIAMANPQTAPYGSAAIEVLNYYHLYDSVQSKLVFGESIAQTNQFVVSGAAELGFTAKAVVLSPELKGKSYWTEIPAETYSPIEQGVVILKNRAQNITSARQFYDFLFSPKGKEILNTFGYETDTE